MTHCGELSRFNNITLVTSLVVFTGMQFGHNWSTRDANVFNPCPWHKTPAFRSRALARNRSVPDATVKTMNVTLVPYTTSKVEIPPNTASGGTFLLKRNSPNVPVYRCRVPDDAVPGTQVDGTIIQCMTCARENINATCSDNDACGGGSASGVVVVPVLLLLLLLQLLLLVEWLLLCKWRFNKNNDELVLAIVG